MGSVGYNIKYRVKELEISVVIVCFILEWFFMFREEIVWVNVIYLYISIWLGLVFIN